MHQWNGRRAGEVLTEQTNDNASPEARLHQSIKTNIARQKGALVRAQSLVKDLSATLKQIKENEEQLNTFKKS